jgi:hypothetical protein
MTVELLSTGLLLVGLFLGFHFAAEWQIKGVRADPTGIGSFFLEVASIVFIFYTAIHIRELPLR